MPRPPMGKQGAEALHLAATRTSRQTPTVKVELRSQNYRPLAIDTSSGRRIVGIRMFGGAQGGRRLLLGSEVTNGEVF